MKRYLVLALAAGLLFGCKKSSESSSSKHSLSESTFPSDFKYQSYVDFNLDLVENEKAVYKIFGRYGQEKDLIAVVNAVNGKVEKNMLVAAHFESLQIERWTAAGKVQKTVPVNGSPITVKAFNEKLTKSGGSVGDDLLYALNYKDNKLFAINLNDYSTVNLPNTIQQSYALAVDTVNDVAYYQGDGKIYKYDISSQAHSLVGATSPMSGNIPKLEYDHSTGLVWIGGDNTSVKTFNPQTGVVTKSYTVVGLVNNETGGDIAIAKNGQMYLANFSGLYSIVPNGNNLQATRISAENFPFQLTSLGVGSNGMLYSCTNENKSKMLMIDPADGAYTVVKNFNHKVNDFGSYLAPISSLDTTDTDGDGVIDVLDCFPDDSTSTSEEFTPSALGNGTFAYEDLWPRKGDYDFNDLVLRYRFSKVLNAQNKMVRLVAKFNIKALGGTLNNGFALQLDMDPQYIESVTGSQMLSGITTLDAKGLEAGTAKPTIIVFDDAAKFVNKQGQYHNTLKNTPYVSSDTIEIVVQFTEPIGSEAAGQMPFNAFMFVNLDRAREIHLADGIPTSKANMTEFNTLDDDSDLPNGRSYRTSNNLPWAINISHEFRHPFEENDISLGYNHFVDWAISGGANYPDWYKDNVGYRNVQYLYMN